MIKWKFWQRNATSAIDPDLPPEVQEYYESTRRGRKSVAVVLGLATVVVTLLVATILYFGGRFVWQAFFVKNDEPVVTQPEVPQTPPVTTPVEPEPKPTPAPKAKPAKKPAKKKISAPKKQPAATSPNTPNTGPGNVLAIATGVALASGVAYDVRQRRVKSRR